MFQLAATALVLLATFYGSAPMEVPINEHANIVIPVIQTNTVDQPLTLEEYVRNYFADTPVLAEIAKCESRFRHLGANGKVIRGELSTEDVGIMQISEFYHEERAEKLGLNLHTLDGNLAYAKWLYGKEGVAPWLPSVKCWQKADTLAKANTKTTTN